MEGTLVGRILQPEVGPILVAVIGGVAYDITTRDAPTMRDLLEVDDVPCYLSQVRKTSLGEIDDINQGIGIAGTRYRLLAPNDLQAVKACGVTFARSMVERVIEEKAAGNPQIAAKIREEFGALIGTSLRDLRAGSHEAQRVKRALIAEGLWSQYLEVGIGPDAEVFTKAQVMSSIGHGSDCGIHPDSRWNNPEPEVVLAVDSQGRVKGATLGNDVNLRDFEGRSALLLSKAKDNNASCAIGPFIRLFDASYGIDDVRHAQLDLVVRGEDGFELRGSSSMSEISRDPLDLVSQVIGPYHQYPDGFMLFLGTLFAPTEDRDVAGEGFTHKTGDLVSISNGRLGTLTNRVRPTDACEPWTFGVADLMRNLAQRALI